MKQAKRVKGGGNNPEEMGDCHPDFIKEVMPINNRDISRFHPEYQ